jgi:hypothetical protein
MYQIKERKRGRSRKQRNGKFRKVPKGAYKKNKSAFQPKKRGRSAFQPKDALDPNSCASKGGNEPKNANGCRKRKTRFEELSIEDQDKVIRKSVNLMVDRDIILRNFGKRAGHGKDAIMRNQQKQRDRKRIRKEGWTAKEYYECMRFD